MEKLKRGSYDVLTESNSDITFGRWKDNKVITVVFTLHGQSQTKKLYKVYQGKIW